MKLEASVLTAFVLLALSPAFAKDKPAGPRANVGTMTCTSAEQATTTEISYFKLGSVSSTATCSSGGSCQETSTEVFEVHVPLSSFFMWFGVDNNNGVKTEFTTCAIRVPGKSGTTSLAFKDLVVNSVLAVGKRGDDSPLPDYYTDVVFGPANTGSPTRVSWDLGQQKGL